MLLIPNVPVAVQRLNAAQAHLEVSGERHVLEINRQNVLVLVEREVDLSAAMI